MQQDRTQSESAARTGSPGRARAFPLALFRGYMFPSASTCRSSARNEIVAISDTTTSLIVRALPPTRITFKSLRSFDENTINTTKTRLIRTIRDGASQPQHPEKETAAFHPLIANKLTCQACSQTHVICFPLESVFEPLIACDAFTDTHPPREKVYRHPDPTSDLKINTKWRHEEWIWSIGGGSSTIIPAQPNGPRHL